MDSTMLERAKEGFGSLFNRCGGALETAYLELQNSTVSLQPCRNLRRMNVSAQCSPNGTRCFKALHDAASPNSLTLWPKPNREIFPNC